jgi:hypothetical protein
MQPVRGPARMASSLDIGSFCKSRRSPCPRLSQPPFALFQESSSCAFQQATKTAFPASPPFEVTLEMPDGASNVQFELAVAAFATQAAFLLAILAFTSWRHKASALLPFSWKILCGIGFTVTVSGIALSIVVSRAKRHDDPLAPFFWQLLYSLKGIASLSQEALSVGGPLELCAPTADVYFR